MDIQREKEFVSQYHYDARNFEWEKENGIPETKVDVNFQLINRDQQQNTTSLIVILSYMIVFDGFVISGTTCLVVMLMNQANSAKMKWKNWLVLAWTCSIV